MEELIKILILGVVEGLTEFLPISSTGHLIVATEVLNFENNLGSTFEIFIQIGAVIAVIAYYRADFLNQARTIKKDSNVQRLWLGIVVAFIPAAVLGVLFEDQIDAVLFSPTVVAISLIIGGIIFIIVERSPLTRDTESSENDEAQTLTDVTLKQAFLIGVVQTFALVPGVSRSGASIIGGMVSGLHRKVATQFSFYLAIPTLGGATVYKFVQSIDGMSGTDLVYLILGAVISGIVAWLSIGWLLRYVSSNSFIPFGYYRIFAGIVILLLILGGVL